MGSLWRVLDARDRRAASFREPAPVSGPRCRRRWRLSLCLLLGSVWLLAGAAACQFSLPGAGTGQEEAGLTVLAASSLAAPFSELGHLWAEHPGGGRIEFNFASSHYLVLQLLQGAPGDLLATANREQVQRCIREGLVQARTVMPMARNALSLVVHPQAPLAIRSLEDLAQPGLRIGWARPGVPLAVYTERLLAAGPETRQALFRAGLEANILTYDANARTVRNRLLQGEVDAAILYASDARALQDRMEVIPLDPDRQVPVTLYFMPLQVSRHPEEARAFMDYVLSARGQAVLQAYGFEAYAAE